MEALFKILWLSVTLAITLAKPGFGPGRQDWGYVEVRPKAHMFWWLYKTTANVAKPTERPLIIWLQGGPGASSTGYGNFAEIGPLDVDLKERNHTWVKKYNVLFIDNPVGTGFSYVTDHQALARNNTQIGKDLVTCLNGFLEKLKEFKGVPIFVAAESYGGKMAVDFALELDKSIKAGKSKANLRGISLVDAWISPVDSVLTWAPFLLHAGVIDRKGYDAINQAAQQVKEAVANGQFLSARKFYSYTQSEVSRASHGISFYNILAKVSPMFKIATSEIATPYEEMQKIEELMNGPVKKALKLNVTFEVQSRKVYYALAADFMRPVTYGVEDLLNNTKIAVQVVTGQLDLIVDTPGTVQWVDRLHFPRGDRNERGWQQTPRKPLTVFGYMEGYYKILSRFGLYWVNRSGHMVPADNPLAMDVILDHLMKYA